MKGLKVMDIKGSKTEQNLGIAFAGESQARNKYTYFSSIAKKEGYNQIADIFTESANNEKEHAKIWFKYLNGGEISSTKENLKKAAEGENSEWTTMYKEFAKKKKKEGFTEIAQKFKMVADIEKKHEERFKKCLSMLENDTLFKKDKKVMWICKNCGHIHYGENAPQVCPLCNHDKGFFEVNKFEY